MGRRKRQAYTLLGEKISRLAKNQSEIAQTLELTQQSVSAKLCGKVVWLISDLEKLSKQYDVPLLFFVEESITDPEVAKSLIGLSTLPADTLTALAGRLAQRSAEQQPASDKAEPEAEPEAESENAQSESKPEPAQESA